jgi:transcriptional regulator with XRE-family HTH domain
MSIHISQLSNIRHQRGLKLLQVAVRARVLPERLWLAERGYPVDDDTATRVAHALDTTVEQLTGQPEQDSKLRVS